jgi:NAD(P)-dependent dehydrogenase (short-subunit alcohol dehydrogenase family)
MVGVMTDFSRVLITGASSGIGEALALALAAPGVTLHLSGRDAGRLAAVAEACRARGAATQGSVLDVRDGAAMAAWVAACGRLDLVVANAGISAGAGEKAPETAAQTRAIFATNLDGVLNTVLPAIETMQGQPPGPDGWRGRIVVVASIAAFVAGAAAPAYCASKAAADAWTVATALGLRRDRIALTSVCPGYIRTAMTARNRFPMPGLMDADRAARIILRGVAAGRIRVIFPWWMGIAARIGGLVPPRLVGLAMARLPAKAPLSGDGAAVR